MFAYIFEFPMRFSAHRGWKQILLQTVCKKEYSGAQLPNVVLTAPKFWPLQEAWWGGGVWVSGSESRCPPQFPRFRHKEKVQDWEIVPVKKRKF